MNYSVSIIATLLLIACGQRTINVPSNAMDKFDLFKRKEKFLPDDRLFYPGIADKFLRPILTEKINLAARDFEVVANKGAASAKEYQEAIRRGLGRFSDLYLMLDTEDRERICSYFEELMDIVGMQSSGGYLNDFMYGFDPSKGKSNSE